MNFFKFLYDVFVYITSHYSAFPEDFKKKFKEENFVNARLFLSGIVESDSTINYDFKDYE